MCLCVWTSTRQWLLEIFHVYAHQLPYRSTWTNSVCPQQLMNDVNNWSLFSRTAHSGFWLYLILKVKAAVEMGWGQGASCNGEHIINQGTNITLKVLQSCQQSYRNLSKIRNSDKHARTHCFIPNPGATLSGPHTHAPSGSAARVPRWAHGTWDKW